MLAFFTHPTLKQRPTIFILTYNALQLDPLKILAFIKVKLNLICKGYFIVKPIQNISFFTYIGSKPIKIKLKFTLQRTCQSHYIYSFNLNLNRK